MKVIKRSGKMVDFDAGKINNMAHWAVAGNEGKVSWSDLVMLAFKQLPSDVVTTDQIQQALIRAALDMQTIAYNRVAGRLLLGEIRKTTKASLDFTTFYKNMVETGYWRNMNYTDEQLVELAKHIDHDKDLVYGYPTLRQFIDKYCVKDVDGNLLELPQYSYMGIAMSLFENQPLKDVILYYDKASAQKINIPSPVMTGQRTKSNVGVSCVIATAGDSVQGIETTHHIAAIATASSAGLGLEYDVRSPKDDVRQGYAKAGGKLPHYRVLEAKVKELKQQSRGGSATVSFKVIDPEIETLLALKLPRSPDERRIDQLDYSLLWNNTFISRAAKQQPWPLVSVVDCKEMHDKFYGDSAEYESLVQRVLNDSSIKKVVVNAMDILKQWITSRNDTGRVYRTNLTAVNTHTPFKQEIRLSNLCVAPETKILTKNGYEVISDLEGESVTVWNGKEWSDTVVVKTGENQKLLTVKTNAGFELTCTPYHKFYIACRHPTSGNTRVVEKRAYELVNGDKLIKCNFPIIEGHETMSHPYANGFYSGDGCLTKQGRRIYLYGEKRRLKPFLGDIFKNWFVQENQDREYGHSDLLLDKFFVPNSDYDIISRIQWFEGLCDSDGTVSRNGATQSIQVGSINHYFLQEVQMMLQTLGVSSKVTSNVDAGERLLPLNDGSGELGLFNCQKAYRLLIGQTGINNLQALGFSPKRLVITDHKPNRECSQFVKITEVVDNGRVDDTYCFTESKRGMGVFNGILTGQCQEVLLPTLPYNHITELYKPDYEEGDGMTALCFLSAIDVGRITSDKDYEDTAYIVCKSLDLLIDNMNYPFPQWKYTANAYRSIGVGITNLAYTLAKNKKQYNDVEFINKIAERHYYFLLKASVKLAKQRGVFKWIDKTKWVDGWLPIDTYNKNVDKLVTTLHYDWEALRSDVLEYGVRFSVLAAHMPCESSSVFGNSINGVYLPSAIMTLKDSKSGVFQFYAPDSDKYQYQLCWDVPFEDVVKTYAVIQKWTDQTISADTYLDYTKYPNGKVNMSEQIKNYLIADQYGVKTLYYAKFQTGRGMVDEVKSEDSGCESCSL